MSAASIADLVRQGREARPPVHVSEELVAAHLRAWAERDRGADPAAASVDPDAPRHGADLCLVVAVCAGDRTAVLTLRDLVSREAEAAARRLRSTQVSADDLAQRVSELLWTGGADGQGTLRRYDGRAPLGPWLRVVAYREGLRMCRGRREQPDEDALLAARATGDADPELSHWKRSAAATFKACFQDAVASLSVHDRDLLRRHFLDGLAIDAIGKLYEVHRATAARWLARTRAVLLERTRDRLRQRLDLTDAEVGEMMAQIESRLEVSLSRVLRARP